MTNPGSRPVLTLAVAAFNHERFIRDAIEGAFAQTYSPLEIILSDDASEDRTFAIMQEMAAAYGGPHAVVLNRNPTNSGVASHMSRIFSIATGELVVANAGDDISLPHRVDAIWQAWEAGSRKFPGVHSRVIPMDQWGDTAVAKPVRLGNDMFQFEDGLAAASQFLRMETPVILGATAAWHRGLVERFGPLPPAVAYEDMALGFRARLLGGMIFIDDPLVLYRLHDANLHNWDACAPTTLAFLRAEEKRRRVGLERRLAAVQSFHADLRTATSQRLLTPFELREISTAVDAFAHFHELELDFRGSSWLGRLRRFPQLMRTQPVDTSTTKKLWHHLLPRWAYYPIRILKSRIRSLRPL